MSIGTSIRASATYERWGAVSAKQAALIGVPATLGIAALATWYPIEVLGLLVALILVALVLLQPAVGLVSLFALEPFWGAFYTYFHEVRGLHFGPLTLGKDALIVGLLIRAIAYDVWRTRQLRIPRSGTDRLIIAYVIYYVVLAVASPNLRVGAYGAARVIEGPLLMFALMYLRPSRRTLIACGAAIVAAATVIGIGALVEHFVMQDGFQTWYGAPKPALNSAFYSSQGTDYRSGSFLASPLTLAFYLATAGAFAIGLARAVRARWRSLAIVGAALCFAGVAVTVTRSGYIGASVGAVAAVALATRNPGRRFALVGLVTVGIGVAVVGSIASGNEALLRSHETGSHTNALQEDIDLILARPLGHGIGTTDYVAQRFRDVVGSSGQSTESAFLAKGVEGGIPALVLYLIVIYVVLMRLRTVRRRCNSRGDPSGAALAAGAIGSVLALMGCSLFLGIEELVVEVVVWGAVGIAVAYAAAEPLDQRTSRRALT
jgi:hypothetical protein